MESSKCYWGRFVFPKIDLETGRAVSCGALRKVLASFGITAPNPKADKVTNEVDDPRPKGKGKRDKGGKGLKLVGAAVTAGLLDAPRLYPAGKRLLKPERNLAMAHAPRSGKDVFCWAGIRMADVVEPVPVIVSVTP